MPASTDTTEKVFDQATAEFYIAICKEDFPSPHTLITIGIRDKISNMNEILCSFGKSFVVSEEITLPNNEKKKVYKPVLGLYLKSTVTDVDGHLSDETAKMRTRNADNSYTGKEVDISYKAFRINYNTYVEMIHLLQSEPSICNPNGFAAMLPIFNAETDKIKLELKSLKKFVEATTKMTAEETSLTNDPTSNQNLPNPHYSQVNSRGNSCRNAALVFLDSFFDLKYRGNDVSGRFTASLPVSGKLRGASTPATQRVRSRLGSFEGNIFILPTPPTLETCNDSEEQLQTLEKLFKQLEVIQKTYVDNPETYTKFEAIKALYDSLLDPKILSATNILESITQWESNINNKNIVDHHRWFSFGRKTGTRKIIDEIKADLERKKPKQ